MFRNRHNNANVRERSRTCGIGLASSWWLNLTLYFSAVYKSLVRTTLGKSILVGRYICSNWHFLSKTLWFKLCDVYP